MSDWGAYPIGQATTTTDNTGNVASWNGVPIVTDPNSPPNRIYWSQAQSVTDWPQQDWQFKPQPARRGVPRRLALVWLERADEDIPAPWTGCVCERFFDHDTASHGVIVESPDIPWETQPGNHVYQFPSWDALDTNIRRHTLQQAADLLPKIDTPDTQSIGMPFSGALRQLQQAQARQYFERQSLSTAIRNGFKNLVLGYRQGAK